MNFTEMSFNHICPDNFYDNSNIKEKLLIFSILTIEFIFTNIYYGLEYYFNNTYMCLLSIYVLYKLQQIHLHLHEIIEKLSQRENLVQVQPKNIDNNFINDIKNIINSDDRSAKNFEHKETSFVFNEKTKKVVGKQNPDGTITPLTVEDINMCNKFKFEYQIPFNLQEQDKFTS